MPNTRGALLNYTTTIEPHTSLGEIIGLLTKHGADNIQSNYQQGGLSEVAFMLHIGARHQAFRLPVNIDAVLTVLQQQRTNGMNRAGVRIDRAQAARVAWRIVKDWIEAQIAFIESGMVKTEEVFLPYLITSGGETLFELTERQMLALPAQKEDT